MIDAIQIGKVTGESKGDGLVLAGRVKFIDLVQIPAETKHYSYNKIDPVGRHQRLDPQQPRFCSCDKARGMVNYRDL